MAARHQGCDVCQPAHLAHTGARLVMVIGDYCLGSGDGVGSVVIGDGDW